MSKTAWINSIELLDWLTIVEDRIIVENCVDQLFMYTIKTFYPHAERTRRLTVEGRITVKSRFSYFFFKQTWNLQIDQLLIARKPAKFDIN